MKYHGYSKGDYIPCMVCNSQAVDIHHIVYRSRAHRDFRDHISNLISLCRSCHNKAHDEVYGVTMLLEHNRIKEKNKLTEKELRYGKNSS